MAHCRAHTGRRFNLSVAHAAIGDAVLSKANGRGMLAVLFEGALFLQGRDAIRRNLPLHIEAIERIVLRRKERVRVLDAHEPAVRPHGQRPANGGRELVRKERHGRFLVFLRGNEHHAAGKSRGRL